MPATNEFQLPESLTIVQAQSLHDQFEQLVEQESCEQIVLRADTVERTDTAGLQLLLALVLAAKDRQINLVWDRPSAGLLAGASTLGLRQALGLH